MHQDIIFSLNQEEGESTLISLRRVHNGILQKLKENLGSEYEITSKKLDAPNDGTWSHDINIKKGYAIGTEVTLHWNSETRELVQVDISQFSPLQKILLYTLVIPFVFAGIYMAVNDIEPLAFLPGRRKLAGALGGIFGSVPGAILFAICHPIFLNKYKKDNTLLVNKVNQILSNTAS